MIEIFYEVRRALAKGRSMTMEQAIQLALN